MGEKRLTQTMNLHTYTYSDKSTQELSKLFKELSKVFPCVPSDFNDLFNSGVFMHDTMYVNNDLFNTQDLKLMELLPPEMASPCQKPLERLEYVRCIISQVISGEIEKPEWMNYLEENIFCGPYALNPSTYLYLKPKAKEYEGLGSAIRAFLYSTEHLTEERSDECEFCL